MMSEAVLDDILRQYIDAGNNPSQQVLAALAQATGRTAAIIKEHYTIRYKEATGSDDDPFGPVMPIVGP